MAQLPIEDLLKRCGSIYKLVILAAKRAKEITDGSLPLVDTPQRKVTSIALEEILHGKVLYKIDEPHREKKRGAKAKDDKKKKVAA